MIERTTLTRALARSMPLALSVMAGTLIGCDPGTPSSSDDGTAMPAAATQPSGDASSATSAPRDDDAADAADQPTTAPTTAPDDAGANVTPPPLEIIPAPVHFELASKGMPVGSEMWKCDPLFFDANADGHQDVVVHPRLGHGPRLWYGDGTGNWADPGDLLRMPERSCGGGIRHADFNGDGRGDLVVADHCNGVFVYLATDEHGWDLVVEGLSPAEIVPGDMGQHRVNMVLGVEDVAAGDVDGDGDVDLITAASDEGGLHVFLNDGTGRNWERQITSLPIRGWVNRAALIDLDGDDMLDLVATHSDGPRVWYNDGAGDWIEASDGLPLPSMQGIFQDLAIGDVNSDGLLDLVCANWINGPEAFVQTEDGLWKQLPDLFPQMLGGSVGLDLGDVDQDGHLDIAVSGRLDANDFGYSRGVFLLRGHGDGTFTFHAECGLPRRGLASTHRVTIADFTGDGLPDIAAGSGLGVETADPEDEPIVPEDVLIWRTRRVSEDERTAQGGE